MESKRKKVLFLITKSNWGGAQRYVYDLATGLDLERFEAVVALGGDGELAQRLTAANVRVISIPSLARDISITKEFLFVRDLWRILKTEQPDIFHVNSSKAGGVGTLLGRLMRVPRIIFTAHGWAFNEERPWWQRFIIKFLHWITVILSHETIAVSKAIVEQLSWPGTKKRMRVIRLGREEIDFRDREDARQLIAMKVTNEEQGLYTHIDDLWIGTIAELHPIKNLSVAIDAVAILIHAFPKLRYIIIGEGEERVKLIEQIDRLGLREHVFLVGALPEAARLLKAFDCFVLPSRSEASGYVLLEAGLANLPVVASRVGGIPELITDDHNGLLVRTGDAEALTHAISNILHDHTHAKRLANTLHSAATFRTLKRMIEETMTCYSSTIDKGVEG